MQFTNAGVREVWLAGATAEPACFSKLGQEYAHIGAIARACRQGGEHMSHVSTTFKKTDLHANGVM